MATLLNVLSRALLVWLLLIAAACLHGAARQLLVSPRLDQALAQFSLVVGVAVIFVVTWGLAPWLQISSARRALAVGGFWSLLTLVFQFALGELAPADWPSLRSGYDLENRGLTAAVLLAMALTPWTVWRLQVRRRGPSPSNRNRRNAL